MRPQTEVCEVNPPQLQALDTRPLLHGPEPVGWPQPLTLPTTRSSAPWFCATPCPVCGACCEGVWVLYFLTEPKHKDMHTAKPADRQTDRCGTHSMYDVHHVVGFGRFQRDNCVKLRNQTVTLGRKRSRFNQHGRVSCLLWVVGDRRGKWGRQECRGWTDSVPAGLAKQSPKIHSYVTTTLK